MADLFQEMELIQLIMWILGISKMWSIPWEFGFEVFHEFLKMRGLDSQSWVFDSQNHLMSTRNSSYQWFMKTLNLSSLFLNENFILIWSIMNKSITAIILDFQKSRNSDFLQNHVRVHHAVKFLILVSFYFQNSFFFIFCVNRDLYPELRKDGNWIAELDEKPVSTLYRF